MVYIRFLLYFFPKYLKYPLMKSLGPGVFLEERF